MTLPRGEKPRVLWAFFDCNGHLGEVAWTRRLVIEIARASYYETGGKAVKFVEALPKPKARKAGRKQ